jgi:hypothetical protein
MAYEVEMYPLSRISPYVIVMSVITVILTQALQGFARYCNFRISRRVSLLGVAA